MVDIPIKNHKLFDALFNREYKVQKETPKLEADGSISITPILSVVPEARSCKNTTCLWAHIVKTGGSPCDKCRHLVKGDYFVPESKDLP